MSKILIPDVQVVTADLSKSNPPQLLITAIGEVPTGGWTKPELANFTLQRNGTLVVDFLIEPPAPDSMVTQAFQKHSAQATYSDSGVVAVVRVRVRGANGDWAEVPVGSAPPKIAPTAMDHPLWPPDLPRPFPWPFPQPLPFPLPPLPKPGPLPIPPIKPPRAPLLIGELKGYLVRLIRPDDIITADFRSDRVNFYLTTEGRIERHAFF